MKSIVKIFIAIITINTFSLANTQELKSIEEEQTQLKPIDFSMVISGGVSLGAYESGYNWAVIKMLSEIKRKNVIFKPSFKSVSGASAGSINALLSAIYWCQDPSKQAKNRVEDNLFYETWVNLGLEDLMIKGKDPTNKSTLFSRKALREKADNIMKHLDKPIYREGCEVPMGFAVTKVTPIVEEFQGIQIKNQTFSLPYTFKIKNGKVIIENREMPPSNAFYLSTPGIEKDYTKVVDVLFASSAFPGAFQQVKMKYKYKDKIHSSYFIDGGAFNNIPLDLATELDHSAKLFIFMDPNNMRKEPVIAEDDVKENPPVGFLTSSASPLTSSLEIFQQMQLYQAINKYFRNNPNRKLILSSRFHPLTAGYLEHFAAFLDQNFRQYDYHVGVYDAIYHLAKSLKNRGDFKEHTLIEVMEILMKHLAIDKNKEAYTAYKFFLATEFKLPNINKKNKYASIYYAFNTKLPDKERYTTPEFKSFLTKLDMRYLPVKKKSFLASARKDIQHWGRRPIRHIVNRITTLENERAEAYPSYSTTAKAISMGAWAGSSLLYEKEGWNLFPLYAPIDKGKETLHTMLRFLPSEISTDTVNGGLSLGYNAFWYRDMGMLDGFEFKPSYNFNSDDGDFIRMDLNTFATYDDFVKFGVGVSAFGNMEGSFYEKDRAYGANAYIDIMDILRITFVRRHGDGDQSHLYLGIENIPSLIYWLNR